MRKAYTISSSKIYGGDFQKWAEEGLDIAKLYVYPGKLSFISDHSLPNTMFVLTLLLYRSDTRKSPRRCLRNQG